MQRSQKPLVWLPDTAIVGKFASGEDRWGHYERVLPLVFCGVLSGRTVGIQEKGF